MQDICPAPISFSVAELIDLVIPAPVSAGRFRALSPQGGTARVYGGQYIAQAIMAAGQMMPPERTLHSINGQFLSSGRIDHPMEIRAEPLRQGRGFSIVRVDTHQDDRLLFTATLSFQTPEDGPAILGDAPPLPAPEGWMTEGEYLASIGRKLEPSPQLSPGFFTGLIERRSRSWRDEIGDHATPAHATFWHRLAEPVSAHRGRFDPALEGLLHQALIGYFSDLNLMATGARPLGLGPHHPLTRSSSLSHSILFHAAQRVDEWHFSVMNGLGINQGRAAAMARIYNQSGKAVITTAQEGIVRRLAS